MANYLVTGGAGFVGFNLVSELVKSGHTVTVIDNYAGGKRKDRFVSGAEYVEGDVTHFDELMKVMSGIDGVFHLAALPRVSYTVEYPIESHTVNVTGTLLVLEAARQSGVSRVVFASSAAIYGNGENIPYKESDNPAPISPYAVQKRIGEEYCALYASLYGLQTVSLRYFNIYGPSFDPTGPYALVVGKFMQCKKENQPLPICGDGEYERDYIHVFDVVSASVSAMTSGVAGNGEIINVGTGIAYTVKSLASLIGGPVVHVPERTGDARKTKADITKAKELLNWKPSIALEQGIEDLKKLIV